MFAFVFTRDKLPLSRHTVLFNVLCTCKIYCKNVSVKYIVKGFYQRGDRHAKDIYEKTILYIFRL